MTRRPFQIHRAAKIGRIQRKMLSILLRTRRWMVKRLKRSAAYVAKNMRPCRCRWVRGYISGQAAYLSRPSKKNVTWAARLQHLRPSEELQERRLVRVRVELRWFATVEVISSVLQRSVLCSLCVKSWFAGSL